MGLFKSQAQEELEKRLAEIEKDLEANAEETKQQLLTASARDYAASQGIELSDYTLIGVSSTPRFFTGRLGQLEAESVLLSAAQELGADVVTDLRCERLNPFFGGTLVYYGTAPVPKSKSK